MHEIMVPRSVFAAFGWVALAAAGKSDAMVTPVLGRVKVGYTPGSEGVAPTLSAVATDRYRVHRVVAELPGDEPQGAEPWSVQLLASTVVEMGRHATVGRSKMPLLPFTVDGDRIGAGLEGWGAVLPGPLNFPPVERLIPAEPSDVQQGPIGLNMKFLGDLAKYPSLYPGDRPEIWRLTWTEVSNPNKPGPVYAHRTDGITKAVALIQPNLSLS